MKPDLTVLDDAVRAHHAAGKSRLTLKVRGFSREEVINRWNVLTSGQPTPTPARPRQPRTDDREDGLERLVRKGRLTAQQEAQLRRWRKLSRLAQLAAGPVKVTNYDSIGGGADVNMLGDGALAESLAAKRELFELRWVVLRGEVDMLTVLDGVGVGGQTIRGLAGGDGNRGRELEAVLRVALNLLDLASRPPVQTAA